MTAPRIAVEPHDPRRPALAAAVEAGGASLGDAATADAAVWTDPADPAGLARLLADGARLRWVQVPFAGVEPLIEVIAADAAAHPERRFTCGKGVYAAPVAEHALMLGLAGMRGLGRYARAASWTGPYGVNLLGAKVTVLGGGEITAELITLLGPFAAEVTVVRNRPQPLPGAARVLGQGELHAALADADLVVLALALTPLTRGIVAAPELAAMKPTAWLVNVARGGHVVTDDLVEALRGGVIAGAALDVTDPEPLPEGHPLWRLPNCLITPHVGNTPEMGLKLLSVRITENVRRFARGEELLGPIYPELGY
ncbi:MAG: D-isomer specific 2-hydroxyacid dehydrogenase family protein [Acidimicrobiales bacterium]